MDDSKKAPLTWEQKAAVGCLALLTLQSIHEFFLLGFGSSEIRGATLGPLSPVLLVSVLVAGWSLLIRTRKGWWCCLLLTSLLGLTYLGVYWKVLQTSWEVRFSTRHLQSIRVGPGFWMLILTAFGFFWVVARSVLLLTVPSFLLLGELRRKVHSSSQGAAR